MKEISWSELKKATLAQIKEGQCLEVTGDGQMGFIIIVKPEGLMLDRIKAIASQIDSSKGF